MSSLRCAILRALQLRVSRRLRPRWVGGLAAVLCLADALLAGCYLHHGGPVWSPDATTVGIPIVVSHLRSDELTRSLEARLTGELRRRASQGDFGGMALAEADDADVLLEVEISGVSQLVIRADEYNVPIERQVVIQTSYTLRDRNGTVLSKSGADSRVTALAGDYDVSRGETIDQGLDSAVASAAQSIIEAIDDDRLHRLEHPAPAVTAQPVGAADSGAGSPPAAPPGGKPAPPAGKSTSPVASNAPSKPPAAVPLMFSGFAPKPSTATPGSAPGASPGLAANGGGASQPSPTAP
ncbi:MAG: LPS assembly lipoprotein LptE [Planctomycetota bacterium]